MHFASIPADEGHWENYSSFFLVLFSQIDQQWNVVLNFNYLEEIIN